MTTRTAIKFAALTLAATLAFGPALAQAQAVTPSTTTAPAAAAAAPAAPVATPKHPAGKAAAKPDSVTKTKAVTDHKPAAAGAATAPVDPAKKS